MNNYEKISPILVGITAALYAAITIAIAPFAYGPIQVRISDAMLVLPFHRKFGKSAVLGLAAGGFLGNIASPYLPWDLITGFALNLVVGWIMYALGYYANKRFKANERTRLTLACLGTIIGSTIIALVVGFMIVLVELQIIDIVSWMSISLLIFIGELIALTVGGLILLSALERALPPSTQAASSI
ncbi:MAG: QueT transporter family protein [Candidatus Korarchaeota archaeon]|nr:QueT transporter family protein [Thermoproteota archaeon]